MKCGVPGYISPHKYSVYLPAAVRCGLRAKEETSNVLGMGEPGPTDFSVDHTGVRQASTLPGLLLTSLQITKGTVASIQTNRVPQCFQEGIPRELGRSHIEFRKKRDITNDVRW